MRTLPHTLRYLALAGVLAAFAPMACATTVRVDDTGTVVSQALVPMRWKQLAPGRGADHTVQADLKVAIKLNLAKWTGQPVRLYMALAPVSSDPVYATWRTQGRLLAGSVRSGDRTLVFNGVVGAAVLEETIDLALRTDGRALVATQALQFYFEIDTP